jgi:hypothetical protein
LGYKGRTFTVTTTNNQKVTGTMTDVRSLDAPAQNILVNARHINVVELP